MIDKIEIPVGTRINAMVDGERVNAVVEKGTCCSRCAFAECERLCAATACASIHRTDGIPVYFKREDNN